MSEYCVISFINLENLPYAYTYINTILQFGNTCTVLYWDRLNHHSDLSTKEGVRYIPFTFTVNHHTNKLSKYLGYLGAINFIRKKLKKENYTGVILLQTHAAVACWDILIRKYYNRYIVDIRDYTLEHIKQYYKRETLVIQGAFAVIISSPAYKNFLPRNQYVVAHNYHPISSDIITEISTAQENRYKKNLPIVISYIGTVRFYDMDKKLIKIFANDKRFRLQYIGSGSEGLVDFCRQINVSNVDLIGFFEQEEIYEYYKESDFVNNLYGNQSNYLDFALSNRLYHSAQLGIPILVCPGTFMAQIVHEYKLGFVFDFDDINIKEKLLEYYEKTSPDDIKNNAKHFLKQVKIDNARYESIIIGFCKI